VPNPGKAIPRETSTRQKEPGGVGDQIPLLGRAALALSIVKKGKKNKRRKSHGKVVETGVTNRKTDPANPFRSNESGIRLTGKKGRVFGGETDLTCGETITLYKSSHQRRLDIIGKKVKTWAHFTYLLTWEQRRQGTRETKHGTRFHSASTSEERGGTRGQGGVPGSVGGGPNTAGRKGLKNDGGRDTLYI